ncbi:MAG: heme o synthase [candidate division KSB1 bacterium]|nr:heme o synthase [candidate division KSB1 bacterium]MDZ7301550.1 heme o synthase [candidate division KSB1 bacterium]MDZ7311034.1 heme o synthase [candidate division KSB1 bacterium]
MTHTKFSDYLELAKPRVTMMVLITTMLGFYLGARGAMDFILLLHTLFGTALVAGGTGALNQYFERNIDAQMRRTQNRPLPAGRLSPRAALIFSVSISIAGVVHLLIFSNWLTALLAAFTLVSYIFLYTPLKQRSSLSTLVGAIPGALPPLGGWAAARGELCLESWVLFAILFLWQLPHFLAIAWIYREDYRRGGLPMLAVIDPEGDIVARLILNTCLVLLPLSLMPTLVGMTGRFYFAGALILSVLFLACGIAVVRCRTHLAVRRLLRASLVYLPALFVLMALDKTSF